MISSNNKVPELPITGYSKHRFKTWFEAVEDHPYAFKAVFMAGSPGSGKSFLARRLFTQFQIADPDHVQVLLSRRNEAPLIPPQKGDPRYGTFMATMYQAQRLTRTRSQTWMEQGSPLVFDMTSREPSLVLDIDKRLKEEGYDTGMIFVATKLETALDRNARRSRQAEEEYLRQTHAQVNANAKLYRDHFQSKFVYLYSERLRETSLDPAIMRQAVGRPYQVQNPIGRQKLQERIPADLSGPQPRTARRWQKNLQYEPSQPTGAVSSLYGKLQAQLQ